jgi:hypothetical protein
MKEKFVQSEQYKCDFNDNLKKFTDSLNNKIDCESIPNIANVENLSKILATLTMKKIHHFFMLEVRINYSADKNYTLIPSINFIDKLILNPGVKIDLEKTFQDETYNDDRINLLNNNTNNELWKNYFNLIGINKLDEISLSSIQKFNLLNEMIVKNQQLCYDFLKYKIIKHYLIVCDEIKNGLNYLLRKYMIDEFNQCMINFIKVDQEEFDLASDLIMKIKDTFIEAIQKSKFSSEAQNKIINKISSTKFQFNQDIKIPNYSLTNFYLKNINIINENKFFRAIESLNSNNANSYPFERPSDIPNAYYDDALNRIELARCMFAGPFKMKNKSFDQIITLNGLIIAHELAHIIDSSSVKINNYFNADDTIYYSNEISKLNSELGVDETISDVLGLKLIQLTNKKYNKLDNSNTKLIDTLLKQTSKSDLNRINISIDYLTKITLLDY